jgi:chromosomal replication initiator protein
MDKESQIVISSDRSPSNLDRMQDRIKSRLSGGLVVDIQQPDFELRIKILNTKLKEIKETFGDNVTISDGVLNFLATEFQFSLREMIGALNRILAFSRLNNNTDCNSISQCKIILKDLINDKVKLINIENIQKIVASFFQISLQEMLSPRRSRSLARPRQIAMYLSKKHTTKSLPDIGRKFSNRDHTTVIHAVRKIDQLIQRDETVKNNIIELKKQLYI